MLVRDEMGRLAAMLTAERLSHGWEKVTLVTSALHPGEGEGITTAYSLIRALGRRGIAIIDRAKVAGLTGKTAALSGVADAAPPETGGASAAFAGAVQNGALAVADGVVSLGSNAEAAASVYEQVDRQVMPATGGGAVP